MTPRERRRAQRAQKDEAYKVRLCPECGEIDKPGLFPHVCDRSETLPQRERSQEGTDCCVEGPFVSDSPLSDGDEVSP